MNTILTIGHSTRSLEDFISILKHYRVTLLIDVRRFPKSRKYPWFSRENLEEKLVEEGIKYVWMGEELGGYRKGGYASYTKTEDFKRALDKLLEISKGETACIMCAEKYPWHCHRKYISIELQNRGVQVIHILDLSKTWKPKPLKSTSLEEHISQ